MVASSIHQDLSNFSFSRSGSIELGHPSDTVPFIETVDLICKGLARRYAAPSSPDYDDLMQIGRAAAINAAKRLDIGVGNSRAYIRRSIKNGIFAENRKIRRIHGHEVLIPLFEESSRENCGIRGEGVEHDGFELVDRADALPVVKAKVHAWLGELSSTKRQVIELVICRGIKKSDVAEKMGLSKTRIGQIVNEAMQNGRYALSDIAYLN